MSNKFSQKILDTAKKPTTEKKSFKKSNSKNSRSNW